MKHISHNFKQQNKKPMLSQNNPAKANFKTTGFKICTLGLILFLVCFGTNRASAQQDVLYYIPLPDQQMHDNFKALTDAANRSISNDIQSTISIVTSEDGTVIVYDHWEDGYEADINNPVQSTTLIWGDGNTGNGNAATVCASGCAGDLIDAGNVITLENAVSIPRNPSNIFYDGGDKIGSSRSLAISRAGYASNPGTVLADATEVIDVSSYDLEYISPVGIDLASGVDNGMFEYTAMIVMAAEDNTSVQIDKDANGSYESTISINEGESYVITGIEVGARILADKPVQADLFTGDLGAKYENRWFTLYPLDLWDNSYYNPVVGPTSPTKAPSYVFLYNDNASSINVTAETTSGSTNEVVPAGGAVRYTMPSNSGAHFYTAGNENFFAVATMDSDPSNSTHDWGLTLLPESYLTQSLVIGWGPGSADLSVNGNPVWILASEPATIYVDYDGDPTTGAFTDLNGDKYDVEHVLGTLEFVKLYDPDKDQTGMRVYTCNGALLAGAWGQDPSVAGCCSPYLDMGTTIPPNLRVEVFKTATLSTDNDSDGKADAGDKITYTITVVNRSLRTRNTVTISDNLPANTTYDIGSTGRTSTDLSTGIVTPVSIPDDGSGTAYPLDGSGYVMGDLVGATKEEIEFIVTVNVIDSPVSPPGQAVGKTRGTKPSGLPDAGRRRGQKSQDRDVVRRRESATLFVRLSRRCQEVGRPLIGTSGDEQKPQNRATALPVASRKSSDRGSVLRRRAERISAVIRHFGGQQNGSHRSIEPQVASKTDLIAQLALSQTRATISSGAAAFFCRKRPRPPVSHRSSTGKKCDPPCRCVRPAEDCAATGVAVFPPKKTSRPLGPSS